MKTLNVLSVWTLLVLGILAVPFRPYEPPHFGGVQASATPEVGPKLALKRSISTNDIHPEIARVQAVNRAYKKFAKRYISQIDH